MADNRAWLELGLRTLARDGASALRIDALAAHLGLSKGSFYHHFEGIRGYHEQLLAYYESEYTARLVDVVEQRQDLSPERRLRKLLALVLVDDGTPTALDTAVRVWAGENELVMRTQARIDAARTEYVRDLCGQVLGDRRKGLDLAWHIYLVMIGAQHHAPRLQPREVRRLLTKVIDRAVTDAAATTSRS